MRALLIGLALAAAAAAQPAGTDLDRAYDEFVAAHVALRQAQEARDAGVEPHAGERIDTVGAGSRFTDEYWERQKRLDGDVERARQRLDRAIGRWNALR